MYDYGNWIMVVLNIGIFLYFLYTAFQPRTKTDWLTFNSFGAFIVALFAEMYGFPLTIYLLTSTFGNKLGLDFSHDNGHLLTTLLGIKGDPHFNPFHLVSNILIIGGLLVLGSAWKTLYTASRRGRLATGGAYRYLRHPQYLAFIAIIFGFLLQWPTLITLVMAPILIFRYVRLAKTEDTTMQDRHPVAFRNYSGTVSGFLPDFRLIYTDLRKYGARRNVWKGGE
jgi:protein-S-isoprenylcysteine O-methyltransferase Ste14